MINSKLHQLRDCYRRELRREEISKYRKQIRQALLNNSYKALKECSFCLDLQLIIHPIEITINQICEAFNKQFVCPNHIEILLTKVLEIISQYPNFLQHFIYKDLEEESQFYTRKIISNQLLIKIQQMQNQMIELFSNLQGFCQKLLDCAYGLSNGSICQQTPADLSRKADIKRISFNTLLFIFFRYPLLLTDFFDEYPMIWLLRQCNQNRLLQIYEVLFQIFHFSQESLNQSKLILKAQECLKQHIQQTKLLKFRCQVEQKLFQLVDKFLQLKPLPTPQMMFEILSLCKAKRTKKITKICKGLVDLSWSQSLTSQQQQVLMTNLQIAQQFYADCDREMEIEEL